MQHLADVRSAQDHALRESLAFSSFSALTLVVAVMLAGVLFATPPGPVDKPREWEWPPIHDPVPPPTPEGDPAPRGGPEAPGPLVATASEPADTTLLDPWPDTPLAEPAMEDPGTGTTGTAASGGSGGIPVEDPIPSPSEYIVHDELPQVVHRLLPEYPSMLRGAGMEGRVLVRVFVGLDGRVRRAEIEGRPTAFDETALAAVRQWVFTPAKANGQPVAVWMRIPVVFRLD